MTNTTQNTDLLADLARMGVKVRRTTPAPQVCTDFVTEYGKTLFAAEWGLDSNQDVSRGGTISCGPFKDCQWMLVSDGHGSLSTVPRFLRSLPDAEFERCMSTNDPGGELEKLLATWYPEGTNNSGACVVMARITLCGEIELWNAGDSRGIVLSKLDGEVTTLLRTIDHSAQNPDELIRLLRDKYPWVLAYELPNNPSIEELHEAGLKCGLLRIDNKMLVPLTPIECSKRPRATLEPGFRVNFSSSEKNFQMSRSIGHQPLGVTGTNWDYYRVRAPLGARIHVVLASDGLWDVEPPADILFEWCETGGNAMLHRLAERWVGDWDFEHPWTHNCLICCQRRVEFLETLLTSSECCIANVTAQLRTELEDIVRICKDVTTRTAAKARLNELSSRDTHPFCDLLDKKHLIPDEPYNGNPVRTIQHGIKPDDLSLALCSWNVCGHVTLVKGLVSRIDTPAVFDFATSHPLLGEHCISVHWDGDGYSKDGMQECILRAWTNRQGNLSITPALRKRSDNELSIREAAGKTNDILLDNETPCTSTWEVALGCSLADAGIEICEVEGPICDDNTERFARHGLAHLALVQSMVNNSQNKVPLMVLCVGSGKVTAREQEMAPITIPFYILNIDRPNRDSTEREVSAIPPPPSYPPPSEVDWTPDPSGTPSLANPQLWLMWGGSPRCYAPSLPIEGVLCHTEKETQND